MRLDPQASTSWLTGRAESERKVDAELICFLPRLPIDWSFEDGSKPQFKEPIGKLLIGSVPGLLDKDPPVPHGDDPKNRVGVPMGAKGLVLGFESEGSSDKFTILEILPFIFVGSSEGDIIMESIFSVGSKPSPMYD